MVGFKAGSCVIGSQRRMGPFRGNAYSIWPTKAHVNLPHTTAPRPPALTPPLRLPTTTPCAGPKGFAKLLLGKPAHGPVVGKLAAARSPAHSATAPGEPSQGTGGTVKKTKMPEEACDQRFDPLDPATRRAAQLAPPPGTPAPTEAPLSLVARSPAEAIAPHARVSMEELLPQLVRRIAWAGDRTRGSVQLELGAGRHAGTTVTVHADHGRVRVEVEGAGGGELRDRIDARLKARGLDVESVR